MSYYIVLKTLSIDEIEINHLKENNIIEDVWSNLFVAYSMQDALSNKYQQMNNLDMKLFRILLEEWWDTYFKSI